LAGSGEGKPTEEEIRRFIQNFPDEYAKIVRKVNRDFNAEFHQQSLLLMGVLGGLIFTALVFVLQSGYGSNPDTPVFGSRLFPLVSVLLSLAAITSVVGAFVNLVGGVLDKENRHLALYGLLCLIGVIIILIYATPLLLIPVIGGWGALVIFVVNTFLVGLVLVFLKWPGKHTGYRDKETGRNYPVE
jgi:hypothetical protein